ncbi:hypothetical protein V6N13_122407 [Hibiscus sabdariffa]
MVKSFYPSTSPKQALSASSSRRITSNRLVIGNPTPFHYQNRQDYPEILISTHGRVWLVTLASAAAVG